MMTHNIYIPIDPQLKYSSKNGNPFQWLSPKATLMTRYNNPSIHFLSEIAFITDGTLTRFRFVLLDIVKKTEGADNWYMILLHNVLKIHYRLATDNIVFQLKEKKQFNRIKQVQHQNITSDAIGNITICSLILFFSLSFSTNYFFSFSYLT